MNDPIVDTLRTELIKVRAFIKKAKKKSWDDDFIRDQEEVEASIVKRLDQLGFIDID